MVLEMSKNKYINKWGIKLSPKLGNWNWYVWLSNQRFRTPANSHSNCKELVASLEWNVIDQGSLVTKTYISYIWYLYTYFFFLRHRVKKYTKLSLVTDPCLLILKFFKELIQTTSLSAGIFNMTSVEGGWLNLKCNSISPL